MEVIRRKINKIKIFHAWWVGIAVSVCAQIIEYNVALSTATFNLVEPFNIPIPTIFNVPYVVIGYYFLEGMILSALMLFFFYNIFKSDLK